MSSKSVDHLLPVKLTAAHFSNSVAMATDILYVCEKLLRHDVSGDQSEGVDHKIIPAATADDDISDNCRLWIGNLDSRLTEYALLKILQKFGHLQKFDFLIHKSGPDKGKPRGYCFVTYETKKEAEMAMFKMNGKMALSRRMIVKWAHEETEEKEDNKSTKAIVVDSGPIISADSKIREIEAKLKSMEEARGQLRMQTMPMAPPGSSKLCAANIEARKKLENTKPYVKRPQKR